MIDRGRWTIAQHGTRVVEEFSQDLASSKEGAGGALGKVTLQDFGTSQVMQLISIGLGQNIK
jgi:hypothetical protein